ncbi:protein serine/threonine phosphatase 2C [Hymenopellis radicata]|nr:protein serine/threonine phosphatase 2C [Hymenopellis radicata]
MSTNNIRTTASVGYLEPEVEGESFKYTLLDTLQISEELTRLASPLSYGSTDAITFQPCSKPEEVSQDRFQAIFDGHAGHETVDYALEALPAVIKYALSKLLANGSQAEPVAISQMLIDAVRSFDESIAQALYDLFPDVDTLLKLSDDDVQSIINDSDRGGNVSAVVLRCMRGTTALISLFDAASNNLWVASLGDCQAVIGTKDANRWKTTLLSSNHNGADHAEAERVQQEHPEETEAILNDRVLGAIAVTRALGDHEFKMHKVYTDRVFLNSVPGFRTHTTVQDFIKRNYTPPYVSNVADVHHLVLEVSQEHYLIMCSDGLTDLCRTSHDGQLDVLALANMWFGLLDTVPVGENKALHLLRQALGGDDEDAVSKLLTVEFSSRWMDDTTILVQRLACT